MRDTPAFESVEPVVDESPEVERWHFLRGLRASKLLPAEDINLLEQEAPFARAEDLQQMLIEQELLTPYQARRIREGLADGLILGPYRILDEVGSGGFGQVYKANHTVLDRVVALKLMTAEYCQSRLLREVFRREVAAVTRLNHPNIATTFDANEIEGKLFMAMEFVDGPTLHSLINENELPPIPLACTIMLQAAQGLKHAHEKGLVHRDIKPANILVPGAVQKSGSNESRALIKLIDFGLARLHPQNNRPAGTLLAESGAIVGTPAFMSPEQAVNFHDADCRSDLYSLGCTFYYMLSGQLPFVGKSARATLEMHSSAKPQPLRELRPDVPTALAAIVDRLMAKRPEDRYQTAGELRDAMSEFLLCGAPFPPAAPAGDQPTRPHFFAPPPTTCDHPVSGLQSATAFAIEVQPWEEGEPVSAAQQLRLWLEWCVVVESRTQGEPHGISDVLYTDLYVSLVKSLRPVEGDAPAPSPAQCEKLRSLVEPWVTLKSLNDLDRGAAAQLWRTCQEYDRYFPQPPGPVGLARKCLIVAVGGTLLTGLILAVANWQSVVPAALSFLR